MNEIVTTTLNFTLERIPKMYHTACVSVLHFKGIIFCAAVSIAIIKLFLYRLVKKFCKKKITSNKPIDCTFVYNSNCPICFARLSVTLRTNCGHAFCADCLYSLLKMRYNIWAICPLCRTPLTSVTLNQSGTYKFMDKQTQQEIQFKLHRINKMLYPVTICKFTCILKSLVWVIVFILIMSVTKGVMYLYESTKK